MLLSQDILVVLLTVYINITNVCDCKQAMKRPCLSINQQRPDCQSKRSLEIVCVLARQKLWRFSLAILYQQWISCLHVIMERFTIFLRNLSCQSSYFLWKSIVLFFSVVSRVEMKHLQRSDQAHFHLAIQFRARGYTTHTWVQTQTWACLLANFIPELIAWLIGSKIVNNFSMNGILSQRTMKS